MSEEHTRTIEINGQKFEVDTRVLKRIDTYRVGSRVKILRKNYSGYNSYPGVIVAIDPFIKRPSITVAFVPNVLGADGKIEFATIDADTEDTEIVPIHDDDILPTAETVSEFFNHSIEQKRQELRRIEDRRDYFLMQYGQAIETAEAAEDPSTSFA